MTTECTATFTLDQDALCCHLPDGHAGPHKDVSCEDGQVWWQKERT